MRFSSETRPTERSRVSPPSRSDERRSSSRRDRPEVGGVDAAAPDEDPLADPARREGGHHPVGRREHEVALAVEPVDVAAGDLGDHGVARELERVGAELGVVRADHGDAEEPRRYQAGDPDRARGRDVHEVGRVGLEAGEDVGDEREAELDLLVGRERHRPVGGERGDPGPVADEVGAGGGDSHAQPAAGTRRREAAHRAGDAVRLGEGVGEDDRARLVRLLADAEEGLLDRADVGAGAAVVVGGEDVGQLEPAGEGERGEARADGAEAEVPEPALAAAAAEQADERAARGPDLGVALGRVLGVVVEERAQLNVEQRRHRLGGLAVGVGGERCHRVGELDRRAVGALGGSRARRHRVEERGGRVARRRRPGVGDVDRAVVVGAAGERDRPGVHRLEVVPTGQLREVPVRRRSRDPAGDEVRVLRPGAVPPLPDREEEHHPLDVPRRERRPHPVQRVRERVHEAALAEEGDELVDRAAVGLKVGVVLLGQVPHEDVQRRRVLGEAGRDLDREEGVLEVRDPQRALDRVVVGDRDEVHPPSPRHAVDALRLGERLPEPRAPQRKVPAIRRKARMNVQVAASSAGAVCHHSRCSR